MHILSTERLELSLVNLEDAPFIYSLLNSPKWLKYIGDRQVYSIADAEKYIEEKLFAAYANGGKGGWKVQLKENGKTIGNCGFYQRDFLEMPDLGFAFLPEYIGKGYAYEAAIGCLEYAQEVWKMKECCAITQPQNKASIKLLEKLGFKLDKETRWPNSSEQLLLFKWSTC